MKEYYMSLIDGETGCELECWGPLPWSKLEELYPELEDDENGVPVQYVTIQEA